MSLKSQYLYNIDNNHTITKDDLYRIIHKNTKDNLRIRIFNLTLLKNIRKIINEHRHKPNPVKPCYVCLSILPITMYSNTQLKRGAVRKCSYCAKNAITTIK